VGASTAKESLPSITSTLASFLVGAPQSIPLTVADSGC